MIHLGVSDHSMIYAVRKFIIPKSDPKIKIVRDFKNFKVNDFLRYLSQIPWETTVIPDNHNTCWKIWKSFYLGVRDRHAPFRHVRIRGNSIPWVNSDIKNLMRFNDLRVIPITMLAWHVACNSIVTYSNYARLRSVGMETVARRCDRALAMRSSFAMRSS